MAKRAAKKRKQKGDSRNVFYYMNPKNLNAEIKRYGYSISTGKTLAFYLVFLGMLGLCMWLFTMHWIAVLVVGLVGIACIPILIRNTYKQMYEQQRFSDLNQYMEQILYSFRGNKKVTQSLKDILSVFNEGPMHDTVMEALNYIYTHNEGDVHKDALRIVERKYKNERLRTIHTFLCKVETIGGDFENSIQLLLQDRSLWADRQLINHKERKQKRVMVIGSILISVGLCVFIQRNLASTIEIANSLLTQIATAAMLIADIIIYVITDTKLAVDWLDQKDTKTKKEIMEDYEFVLNFNPKREFLRKSLPYSLIPIAVAALSFFFLKSNFLAIAALLTLPVFVMQHRISYRIKKKNLRKEIEMKFPRWLMEVALQLQSGSVYTAIEKSYETAPTVLKPELVKFMKAREEDRTTIAPYLGFMAFAEMPEIQSSMKMLYSISQGADNDADAQINDIIRRNNLMLDKAEKMRNDDMLSVFYGLMLAPQLTASVKLIIDMVTFLFSFFSYATF